MTTTVASALNLTVHVTNTATIFPVLLSEKLLSSFLDLVRSSGGVWRGVGKVGWFTQSQPAVSAGYCVCYIYEETSIVGIAKYFEFLLLIGNPHMGNTQYGDGHMSSQLECSSKNGI
jgi:hypothetical protein